MVPALVEAVSPFLYNLMAFVHDVEVPGQTWLSDNKKSSQIDQVQKSQCERAKQAVDLEKQSAARSIYEVCWNPPVLSGHHQDALHLFHSPCSPT